MNIEIHLWNIIDLLSFSAAFMIGLLFLTKKNKNRIANIFLTLFLWSLSLEILMTFFVDKGISFELQFATILTVPLLLTYVIKTLNKPIKFKYTFILIPFICESFGLTPSIFNYILIIFILFYTLKIIKNSDKKLNKFYFNIENKAMLWIKHIIYIYLFFYGLWLLEDLISLWFEEITLYFTILSSILTLLMIYWIGYNGFSQSEIFSINLTTYPIQKTEKVKSIKINDNEDLKVFNSLSETIENNKLFTKKDLTIRRLSSQLNINERTFSKLISEHANSNFYQYINNFRVEEFKKLLQTDRTKQITLLGLSEEAGFNSKSTFYTAFKSAEGITPKQYLEKIKYPNNS